MKSGHSSAHAGILYCVFGAHFHGMVMAVFWLSGTFWCFCVCPHWLTSSSAVGALCVYSLPAYMIHTVSFLFLKCESVSSSPCPILFLLTTSPRLPSLNLLFYIFILCFLFIDSLTVSHIPSAFIIIIDFFTVLCFHFVR